MMIATSFSDLYQLQEPLPRDCHIDIAEGMDLNRKGKQLAIRKKSTMREEQTLNDGK